MNRTLAVAELEKFAVLGYQYTGIKISTAKIELMSNRLGKRCRELEIGSFGDYYRYLTANLEIELSFFINAITTNETYFFRCPLHFYMLSKEIFPSLEKGDLRVWSAACSSGEEPYSLAIILLERLWNVHQRNVEVFASDIDYSVLKKASEGVYNEYSLRFVKPELMKKYFKPLTNGYYQVKKQLRERIKLGHHNLQQGFPKGKVDIIFCRNVLIYFDNKSKEKVFDNLINALKPGGYLFLGESEIVPDLPGFKRLKPSIAQRIT